MAVRIKPGVKFAVVAPGGYLILAAIKRASKDLGIDLTVTSGTDGDHSGPTDPHKKGEAYDVRCNNLKESQKIAVLKAVMSQLVPMRFYGFIEGHGTPNEHIHVQRSKGTTFTVEDLLSA